MAKTAINDNVIGTIAVLVTVNVIAGLILAEINKRRSEAQA